MSDAERSFAYEFGEWLVEPDLNRIRRGEHEIQLEPRTSEVLRYLLEHPGEIVSVDQLLDTVWAGRVVEPNAVHRNVNRIRRALDDNPRDPRYVETISKRGYRTLAPVQRVEAEPADLDTRAALQAVTPPFPAYDGEEPFTFVCYSHQDREEVYEELKRLRGAGVNIWYDEGIRPGAEWTEEVDNAISNCAHLLFFISPNSVESTHCLNELSLSLELEKSLLVVYLEQTELPAGLRLQIIRRQALFKYEMREADYARKLIQTLSTAPGEARAFGPTRKPTSPAAAPLPKHPARFRKRVIASAAIGAFVMSVGFLAFREPVLDLFRNIPDNSISIAPFDHRTSKFNAEFISGAIESELRAELRNHGFLVVGSSVFDASQTADTTNAAYVLTGNVTRTTSHIRVTIELFSTDTEYQVFAHVYDIAGDDDQVVQSAVASQMALDLGRFRRGEAPALLANIPEEIPATGGALQGALSQQLPEFSGFEDPDPETPAAQEFPSFDSFDSFDDQGGSDE